MRRDKTEACSCSKRYSEAGSASYRLHCFLLLLLLLLLVLLFLLNFFLSKARSSSLSRHPDCLILEPESPDWPDDMLRDYGCCLQRGSFSDSCFCKHTRDTHMCSYIYIYMYVCMYVCNVVCLCVCLSVCLSVCMYVGIYVCMHVGM